MDGFICFIPWKLEPFNVIHLFQLKEKPFLFNEISQKHKRELKDGLPGYEL